MHDSFLQASLYRVVHTKRNAVNLSDVAVGFTLTVLLLAVTIS